MSGHAPATGAMISDMWVRVLDWMLVEKELPRPDAGSLLRSVGVRARGVSVTAAQNSTPDGVIEVADAGRPDPRRTVYAVTGTASKAQDVSMNTRPSGRGQHAGAEFVLTAGADRFRVQFDGHASDVVTGSRVTATGVLELVGEYEWEDFELTDTRADWLVTQIVDLPSGDIAIELAYPPFLGC